MATLKKLRFVLVILVTILALNLLFNVSIYKNDNQLNDTVICLDFVANSICSVYSNPLGNCEILEEGSSVFGYKYRVDTYEVSIYENGVHLGESLLTFDVCLLDEQPNSTCNSTCEIR